MWVWVCAYRAGATGAVWGACLAALRNESIKFYAASIGTNFFLLTSTYIGAIAATTQAIGHGRFVAVAHTHMLLCL